jgi:WD40 repeat protein
VNLHGPVRADESMGTGKARVVLSLNWKGVPSTTHTLRVLDPAGGESLPVSSRLMRSLPHPDRVANLSHVRFTPEGHLFAAGYPSGVIQIWDLGNGKELRRIESPRGYRGSWFYAHTPADFKTLYVPLAGRSVKRSPDPKKKPRIEYNGKVLIWDLTTGKPQPTLKPEEGRGVIAAYLSPDGSRLITVERASYQVGDTVPADVVRMYDLATRKSWKLGEGYGMAAFSADGRRAYVSFMPTTTSPTSRVVIFDGMGKELTTLSQAEGQEFSWPVLSPDGKRLAVQLSKGRINAPGTMKVFDLTSNKEVASFPSGGDHPFLIPEFSPDGRLLAAGDYAGTLWLWDLAQPSVVRKHPFEGKRLGMTVAFRKDGKQLAVLARVKTDNDRARDPDPLDLPQPRVYLFDLMSDAAPEELICPHGWTGGIAYSPDGKTLAVGGAGAVYLFDVSRPIR